MRELIQLHRHIIEIAEKNNHYITITLKDGSKISGTLIEANNDGSFETSFLIIELNPSREQKKFYYKDIQSVS